MVTVAFVDQQERKRIIQEYVRERLRAEAKGPRGTQAQLAKDLGIEPPHLSNMIQPVPTRSPGEDVRAAAAAHWGLTMAQLEALALGEEAAIVEIEAPAADPRITAWIRAGRFPAWVASAVGQSYGGLAKWSDEALALHLRNLVRAAELPVDAQEDEKPRARRKR